MNDSFNRPCLSRESETCRGWGRPPTTLEPPKARELVNVCENFPHVLYSLVSLLVPFFVVLRASPCLLSIDTFVKRRINATKLMAILCNVRAREESAAKVFRRTWIVYPRSWNKLVVVLRGNTCGTIILYAIS